VFTPPSRPALGAATYAEARLGVAGAASLSAQAFGLAPRIREVDALLHERPALRERLVECHPELAFRRLAGDRVLPTRRASPATPSASARSCPGCRTCSTRSARSRRRDAPPSRPTRSTRARCW
jgi:predicted RNase H-like nuclease